MIAIGPPDPSGRRGLRDRDSGVGRGRDRGRTGCRAAVRALLGLAGGGGTGPGRLATGDFNGDGRPDIVTTDGDGIGATVLLGDGDGGFTPAPASPIEIAGGVIGGATVGDFNHDGKADLAIAQPGAGNVAVMLGNGGGTFRPAPGSPLTAGAQNGPDEVLVGDFNGDGNEDLVVNDLTNTSHLAILLRDGRGDFGPPIGIGVASENPGSVAAADLTGDGKPDLATTLLGGFTTSTLPGAEVLVGDGAGALPRHPARRLPLAPARWL